MTKNNTRYIKLLFFVLILLAVIFSCKKDKNAGRDGTEGSISALNNGHQKQEQYDDESDFEVEKIYGDFGEIDGVVIKKYIGKKKIIHIPPEINSLPVTTIGESAFSYHGEGALPEEKKLTSVTIPDSVHTIEYRAFGYIGLTSVKLGNNVWYIGNKAFASNQLTDIIIPNSVHSIGDEAFAYNQITGVTIPDSVTSIGETAFYGNKLTNLTIPDNVYSIGEYAFAYNKLTDITLGNNVETISKCMFQGNELKVITIPDIVTDIEYEAFDKNPLTTIIVTSRFSADKKSFPNDFKEFFLSNNKKPGTYTLGGSSWNVKLSDIADPKDFEVKIIKGKNIKDYFDSNIISKDLYQYYDNNIILIVDYNGENENVVIPSKIKGLPVICIDGEFKFNYRGFKGSVTIPDSAIYIGHGAFFDIPLTGVTIGNNVKTIGKRAFFECKLKSVVIPNSVTTINQGAFRLNPIESITIPANVNLDNEEDYIFPNDFDNFYDKNKKKAGTYIWDGKNWKEKK